MLFNVAQLLKDPIGSTREYDLVEDLSELDPGLTPLNPLVGIVELLRTHSGVLARGQLSTAVQVTCNRCLEPAVVPVRFTIEENFRPLTEVSTGRYIHPREFKGEKTELEDGALLINEQHMLNLAEVVRQNIWLALPMYPTCIQAGLRECQGFAERQEDIRRVHADLEEATSIEDAIDPRWSALLSLRGDTNTENAARSE